MKRLGSRPLRAWIAAGLVLGSSIGAVSDGWGQLSAVSAALTTPSTTVAPGSELEVDLVIDQAGLPFNAFEAIVAYDPAALTLLPLSPTSLQEGSLVTAACDTRFHRFRMGADRDTITESLLCNLVSMVGPGQLYTLRFRASNTPQVTTIRWAGTRFYDGGITVNPVTTTDLAITIQSAVGVGVLDPTAPASALRVGPNPGRGGTTVWARTARAGFHELVVCDLAGRTVRRLRREWLEPGVERAAWDGRDEAGRRLPIGVYLIRFQSASESVATRFVLVR